ncbi:MAG: NAD(+) synthase [Chloroflexota bacterium]
MGQRYERAASATPASASGAGEIHRGLALDPATACRQIERFLASEVGRLGRRGIVLGLSGGLDSSVCAYLCVRALGKSRVQTLLLPERDSDPANQRHAEQVAERLGLSPRTVDISSIMASVGVHSLFTREQAANRAAIEMGLRWITRLSRQPSAFSEGLGVLYEPDAGRWTRLARRLLWRPVGRIHAFALTKVRARMMVLHYHAMLSHALVVGTTDRSEWSIGFYDKYGDAACDIMPLRHLYKTQIREIARCLGVPSAVIDKPSSGDLAAGLPNEAAIGLSYEQLDAVLWGLDHALSEAQIVEEAAVSPAAIDAVRRARRAAQVRELLPSHL